MRLAQLVQCIPSIVITTLFDMPLTLLRLKA
jgi:hypothetical protein